MDNIDHNEMSNKEFNKAKLPNEYESLLHKLKSIKDRINLLEKIFTDKEL